MGKIKTLEEFLIEAKRIRPELDFSLVTEYLGNDVKIKVICHEKDYVGREHGVFEITPANLLNGKSCPKCKGKGFTSEDRKLFCAKKHNNKYDYSKSDFSNVKKKTIVICKEHGEFEINFDDHFNKGVKCKYCSYPVRDLESFRKEASKIHKDFYSYDNSIYIDSHTNLEITCPIHGNFPQTPNAHLNGQGCPKCANGRVVLEDDINKLLNENNIIFIHNKRPTWLRTNSKGQLSLDFYLPEIKLGIECQGKQHFGLGGWSKNFDFEAQFKRDEWKMEQCKANDVKLVYFANEKEVPKEYIGKIFTNSDELMKYIKYLYKNKE